MSQPVKDNLQMTWKGLVRDYLLPPAVSQWLRPPPKYGPWGHYPTWVAAAALASPYRTSFPIIEEQLQALLRGEHEPPCFQGVHLAAILSLPSPVTVLDFGGGIGMGYFRAMQVVSERIKWWRVVDLPDVIERGRQLQTPKFTFHYSIEEALGIGIERPDIVTCSSVLQCMEDSYGALERLFSLGAKHIVLDRLPLEPQERFSVFHTVSGDRIAWRILSRDRLNSIAAKYRLLFQQTLPHHPSAEAASDEYCLLYTSTS
jgi:putative methyltransferase (TIGR04325 family)